MISHSYLCLISSLALLGAGPAAAFSGNAGIISRMPAQRSAAVSFRRPALSQLRCQTANSKAAAEGASYEIIPSALKESGGGWTIQGVKPVSKTHLPW